MANFEKRRRGFYVGEERKARGLFCLSMSVLLRRMAFLLLIPFALVLALGAGLAGCERQPNQQLSMQSLRQEYRDTLSAEDVEVYRLGDTVHIIIPNDHLFLERSASMSDEGRALTTKLCHFMRTYKDIGDLLVKAYVDGQPLVGAPRYYKRALTRQRASFLTTRFSDCGVNANFIAAVGEGERHPVAWNGTANGRYFNRRVEIAFRYYQ